MQKEGQNNLCTVVKNYIPSHSISMKNGNKSWVYGYNDQFDVIVISKTGEIGDVVNIAGLYIALPKTPKDCIKRSLTKSEQYWERETLFPKTTCKNTINIPMERNAI